LVPISLKQEADVRANHKTKPTSATALFRMLVCSMLDDDVIWYESNASQIIKEHRDLISACKSIIKTKINEDKQIKLIYFKGYVSKCRDDFTDSNLESVKSSRALEFLKHVVNSHNYVQKSNDELRIIKQIRKKITTLPPKQP
jgi:hypothetical protein